MIRVPNQPSHRRLSRILTLLVLALSSTLLSGCGYNRLNQLDEQVLASWAEVLNQYQRRADLVPNLVNTVQGYASHERQVFAQVAEARARVGSIQATPELMENEEAFRRFTEAQGQMTSALSRLLAVAENYPQLKADALFRDLQAQLEGTENRIAVARRRYIEQVQAYNTTVRSFPTNLTANMFGFERKQQFQVENERALATPPRVDFGTPTQPAPPRGGDPAPESVPPQGGTPAPESAPTPESSPAPEAAPAP